MHLEGRRDILLEVGTNILFEHARRKRPERFAPLDFGIDRIFMLGIRIGEEQLPRARGPHSLRS
jgi:hypothetical protein